MKILMLNRDYYTIKKNDNVGFYCKNEYREIIGDYFSIYNEIKDFYLDLYGQNKIEKASIVYLPENEKWLGDGYKRANLVVSTAPLGNIEGQIILMAHELGHAYGNGASLNTFEDWINETNAEWSALLFLNKFYPDLFEERINYHQKRMENQALNLRQDGDKRPDNVHSVGTLIYYEIFQKYGQDGIIDLLLICDRLEEKTTENFIGKLGQLNKSHLLGELKNHL